MSAVRLRRCLYVTIGFLAAVGFLIAFGTQPAAPTGPSSLEHADSEFPTNRNLNVQNPNPAPPANEHLHRTAWDCRTTGCTEDTETRAKGRYTFSCIPPNLNKQGVWDGECGHSRTSLSLTPDNVNSWRYAGHANRFETTWKGCPTTQGWVNPGATLRWGPITPESQGSPRQPANPSHFPHC